MIIPRLERPRTLAHVVHTRPHMMADAVEEGLGERFAFPVFTVLIDVIVSNAVKAARTSPADDHPGFDGGDHRAAGAQNNIVNLRCRGVNLPEAGSVRATSEA